MPVVRNGLTLNGGVKMPRKQAPAKHAPVRCPNCQSMTTVIRVVKGNPIYACTRASCGTKFTSRAM